MTTSASTPPFSPPPTLRLGRLSLATWDAFEPRVLGFVLKIIGGVACIASAPFFLLALLLYALDVPLWLTLLPGLAGVGFLGAGITAYLVLRQRLRRLRRYVETFGAIEEAAWGAP